MIRYVNIDNFGCFCNFDWKKHNQDEFRKLNIIYGRNYSGKTTLSRVLRSFLTGKIPENYDSPRFNLQVDDTTLSERDVTGNGLEIRVYNKDFVDEHLGFLKDSNGKIEPFAIVGSDNKEIEGQIRELELELGEDDTQGLRQKLKRAEKHLSDARSSKRRLDQEIHQLLQQKANSRETGIKHNTIYADALYNVPKLQIDIAKTKTRGLRPLSQAERLQKEQFVGQTLLPDIEPIPTLKSTEFEFRHEVMDLLSRRVAPTKQLLRLANNSELQTWVREGLKLHSSEDNCGYCGQRLPKGLDGELHSHFNEESQQLLRDLDSLKSKILSARLQLDNIKLNDSSEFYTDLQEKFVSVRTKLKISIAKLHSDLDLVIDSINERCADVFRTPGYKPLEISTHEVEDAISELNQIVAEHNQKHETLADDQSQTRDELRLSEVSVFLLESSYEEKQQLSSETQSRIDEANTEVNRVQELVRELQAKIKRLRDSQKDERKGANRVNEYLNNFFGHDSLRLEAYEDRELASYKFRVMRGTQPAFNLSEGECGLISFCYFMAKLEDIDSTEKDLIIYIDDPISSLDSDHIFFVFSLIDSAIAKPVKYKQLFVSTHSLPFLKYLRRLSSPGKKQIAHLWVSKRQSTSVVEPMPKYMRKYVTEFNYLFGEICVCTQPEKIKSHYESFYGFGNNLRKFLEAYLYFKYPYSQDNNDLDRRIDRFFGDELGTESLIKRLVNEFSHLGEQFDRASEPIEQTEISKVACFVLRKIEETDPDQYHSLLDSIDEEDPLKHQGI